MSETILVVDDEQEIADLVKVYLENEGYRVRCCATAAAALEELERQPPARAIVDALLPGRGGFSLCRRIRETHLFPILMLTARVEDMDKITGLSLGADDYMTKPFNPLELVARVKTLLRRYLRYDGASAGAAKEQLAIRGLCISREEHRCTLNGKEVLLTPTEFDILWYLCRRQGKVVSAEELFEAVWGEKYLDSNNTVMAHIARLREKLGEPPRKPRYVKTVWGVGYTVE